MVSSRVTSVGLFVLVALPSLFMVLWTADAILVLAEDVFLIAVLQLVFIAVYMWRRGEADGDGAA